VAQTPDQDRLALVLDPEDDREHLRDVRHLHARPLGQIVCEPDPTTGSNDLAHYLLDALGKTASDRRGAWARAQLLLDAEQIRELILLRAHVLGYPALRRLADRTAQTATRLWLVCPRERLTGPIAQLLEHRPHTRSTLPRLSTSSASRRCWTSKTTTCPPTAASTSRCCTSANACAAPAPTWPTACAVSSAPASCTPSTTPTPGPSTGCVNTPRRPSRKSPTHTHTHTLWHLASAVPTASEALVRTHAAMHALSASGWPVRQNALDRLLRDDWGERRPTTYNAELAQATELADLSADSRTPASSP
jgi:hypothetical protein